MSKPLKKVNAWVLWHADGVQVRSHSGEVYPAPSVSDLKGRVGGNVVVVASRSFSLIKKARVPDVKPQELQQLMEIQATQLFATGNLAIVSTFVLSDDVDGEGRLVTLLGVPKPQMDAIYGSVRAIHGQVVGIIPTAMGSVLIAKEHGLRDAVVIEPTPEGWGIDIVRSGALVYSRTASRTLPVMGEIQRALVASQSQTLPIIAHHSIQEVPSQHRSQVTTFEALYQSASTAQLPRVELPEDVERQRKGEVATRSRLAMLMGVAALGCAAIVWDGRDQAEQKAQSARGAFLSEVREVTKLKDAAQKRNVEFVAQNNLLTRIFTPAQPPSDVLKNAGNLAPKDVWLTGINFERGKPLQIRGVALTNDAVGVYLDALGSSDRLRDAKLVFANQTTMESNSVVQFSISAHVVGNIPSLKTKEEKKKVATKK